MVARDALERAEADESNSVNDSIVCIVFSAFTIEAYINHTAGALHLPWWETVERRLPPKDKLVILGQELGFSIDFASSPFGMFTWIFNFRDRIAHGKTKSESFETRTKLLANEPLRPPPLGLLNDACITNAKKCYDSMREMVEWLNSKTGVDDGCPFVNLGTVISEG